MTDIVDRTVDDVVSSIAGMKPRPLPAHYMHPDYGPEIYAFSPAVAKHRRKGPIAEMTKAARHAYGEAVEREVRAKQRQALQRELPSHNVECASGTNHNTGEAIHNAIRAQQRTALLACPGQERRARTDEQWKEMYEKAMKEKRSRPWLAKSEDERAVLRDEVIAKRPKTVTVKTVTVKTVKATTIATPAPRAGFEIVTAMQKGKFIVKVPPLPDGSKAIPEVIIGNQIKCRFSHRDGGYVATADQVARLQRILEMTQ